MSIYRAGHVSTKEQKIQGRKAELPALCFLNLSAHFYVWGRRFTRKKAAADEADLAHQLLQDNPDIAKLIIATLQKNS